MKIKQTLKTLLIGAFLLISSFTIFAPTTTFADTCGGVQTAIISCSQKGGTNSTVQDTGVWGVLLLAINILTAGIGIAAVGGIIYGAILYTSAGGSQEQVKKAMGVITNVVIGVVAYALMYAGLNFLIPGGLFN
jgi:hypothetical protein